MESRPHVEPPATSDVASCRYPECSRSAVVLAQETVQETIRTWSDGTLSSPRTPEKLWMLNLHNGQLGAFIYSKRRICQNCFRTKGASRDYHRVMRESLEYKAMPDQNCQRSSALAHHHSDSKIYSFGSTNPQLALPIPPVSRFDWDGADALQGIPDDGARLDVVQNKTLGVQKRSLPGN
jgi:hypothetical protein